MQYLMMVLATISPLFLGLFCNRQSKREGGAFSFFTYHLYLAPVTPDDFIGNVQSWPEARKGFLPRARGAIEALKDFALLQSLDNGQNLFILNIRPIGLIFLTCKTDRLV
jgi:hypothetical protein